MINKAIDKTQHATPMKQLFIRALLDTNKGWLIILLVSLSLIRGGFWQKVDL
jgi:hypothetical protein